MRKAFVALVLVASVLPALAADNKGGRTTNESVEPSRFGARETDEAYGAFQRGLYITALNLARPKAEAGDRAAQTLVADIYARGLGVRQNLEEAAAWYAKAAEQGVPEAQFQYALLLLDGKLMERDRQRAATLMRAAADSGNRMAQFNYAQLLVEHEPGGAGLRKAVPYYELAARQGLADAQYAMGQIALNGAGGRPQDADQARRWLEQAARQNFDAAQVELGTLLVQSGKGEAEEKAGYLWIRRAAQTGNLVGQIRLARLLRAGVGVAPDPVEAAAWYVQARRGGLSDPQLDSFLRGLPPEDQKHAIERANQL